LRTTNRNFGYLPLILDEQRLEAWPFRLCIAEVFMSDRSSWRSPSTADQYQNHDYADFAQEYLQRNPDYRRDHTETMTNIADDPEIALAQKEGLAGRWGLCFPHNTTCEPANSTSPVVTGRSARRHRCHKRRHRGNRTAATRL
jgi:hypothetical protein